MSCSASHPYPPKGRWFALAPLLLLICGPAHAGVITINGTDEVGSSGAIDSIGFNQSIPLTDFNFNYTLPDGDTYDIFGQYAARYDNDGTWIYVTPTVVYTGAGRAAGSDLIVFDLFQNYFDDSPGTWDGAYTETLPLQNAAGPGSTISAQLLIDGQELPLVGPYGPGTYYQQNTASLTGLTGDTLAWDYRFQFDFPAARTLRGARMARLAVIPPVVTPEPATAIPCAAAFVILIAASQVLRRMRMSR